MAQRSRRLGFRSIEQATNTALGCGVGVISMQISRRGVGAARSVMRSGAARFLCGLLAAGALSLSATSSPASAQSGPLPFERTEERVRCDSFDPLKQPFFGETHIHTAYSFDAVVLDTRNTPRDAYRYAKGEVVGLPPWADTRSPDAPTPPPPATAPTLASYPYCLPGEQCEFMATRTAQLPAGRALDFAALTDHSEQFGEANICSFTPVFPCEADSDCPSFQVCLEAQMKCAPRGYDDLLCESGRRQISRLRGGPTASVVAGLENLAQNPSRLPLCSVDPEIGDGLLCLENARTVWEQIQQDAEAAYDRSSACSFTSFVAYEYTAMMGAGRCEIDTQLPCWSDADCDGQACVSDYPGDGGGINVHRNIIFRNDDVLPLPISNLESPVGCGVGEDCSRPDPIASPATMLGQLKAACIDNPLLPRCDVLSIPHNPNLSAGAMFLTPEDPNEASIRSEMEPLVEIMQIKGSSECRFSEAQPGAWGAADEECAFESMNFSRLAATWIEEADRSPANLPPTSYVRNTLKSGIAYEKANGVNPFKLGFVGALDNHNGTPGQTEEIDYARQFAHGVQSAAVSGQALNEKFFLGYETNGGGLTAVWAEENSRDSLFHGMRNRETYATSGTRPVVRFFGGFDLPARMCKSPEFAAEGYVGGVPMGGCLSGRPDPEGRCKSARRSESPSFAVLALQDPGWPGQPGTKLERVQIVKGWVDARGETHEQVVDVVGRVHPGPTVDLDTCEPKGGGGNASLCGTWTDPDFRPEQHAFYYARVLENPSCRWNQYYCSARAVDCQQAMGTCRTQDGFDGSSCDSSADCGGGICEPPVSYTEYEYQQCCSDAVPKTIQQRAWTSPIWYTP